MSTEKKIKARVKASSIVVIFGGLPSLTHQFIFVHQFHEVVATRTFFFIHTWTSRPPSIAIDDVAYVVNRSVIAIIIVVFVAIDVMHSE
ncbi:MAG: hypothetical protein ACRDRG_17035 [Pseudonocardiaceae bacterium]